MHTVIEIDLDSVSDERMTELVHVRLGHREKVDVKHAADALGISISSFSRSVLVGAAKKVLESTEV